jgi:hypothetical protein
MAADGFSDAAIVAHAPDAIVRASRSSTVRVRETELDIVTSLWDLDEKSRRSCLLRYRKLNGRFLLSSRVGETDWGAHGRVSVPVDGMRDGC